MASLKYRDPVSGLWVYIPTAGPQGPQGPPGADGTGSGGTDEVWIGADEPTNPDTELWYDTDATASSPSGIPSGGTVEQVLTKTSSVDGAASWQNPAWLVVKSTTPVAADYGLTTIPVGAIWVQSP